MWRKNNYQTTLSTSYWRVSKLSSVQAYVDGFRSGWPDNWLDIIIILLVSDTKLDSIYDKIITERKILIFWVYMRTVLVLSLMIVSFLTSRISV